MFLGPRLTAFVSECTNALDAFELTALLDDMTRSLGFEQFALVSHVDLSFPPKSATMLMTYAKGWIERACTKRYYVDDPIHAASTRTVTGFLWRDVPSMLTLTRRQRRILEEARAFGLCEGLTVPVHAPGEYRGTCSFGARSIGHLSKDVLTVAQVVAVSAFDAARRINRMQAGHRGTSRAVPALSPRQIDCIALVARGKTDGEIATILGLAQVTVHQHVREAMDRYGVVRRTQLVVRALFDGQICFDAATMT